MGAVLSLDLGTATGWAPRTAAGSTMTDGSGALARRPGFKAVAKQYVKTFGENDHVR